MLSDTTLKNQLKFTLDKTNFKFGKKYEGKVRDNYTIDGKQVENPLQEAMIDGQCVVSGYE